MHLVSTTTRRPRITRRIPIYTTSKIVPDKQPIFGVLNWLQYLYPWNEKNMPQTFREVIFRYGTEVLVMRSPVTQLEVCEHIQKDFERFKNWVRITYK